MFQLIFGSKNLKSFLNKQEYSKLCVVVSHVLISHAKGIITDLGLEDDSLIIIKDGEKMKDWSEIKKLLEKFIALGLDRKSIVIAVGGGTVGDSVGFASSIYLRGIRYINIPTTLVSQVDSAHGGKTGVNFAGYKNMVGTFHQAIVTIIETSFLQTLKKEQLVDGLGEIIKAGFIKDLSILKLLEKETLSTLLKSKNLEKIIKKSIVVKQYYIKKDPFDMGVRQLLNAGHTIGHAIELKHKISHGRAVLVGMDREFILGEKCKVTHPSVRIYFNKLLTKLRIILNSDLAMDASAILRDKKIEGNLITWPVVTTIGKSKLIKIPSNYLLE